MDCFGYYNSIIITSLKKASGPVSMARSALLESGVVGSCYLHQEGRVWASSSRRFRIALFTEAIIVSKFAVSAHA